MQVSAAEDTAYEEASGTKGGANYRAQQAPDRPAMTKSKNSRMSVDDQRRTNADVTIVRVMTAAREQPRANTTGRYRLHWAPKHEN